MSFATSTLWFEVAVISSIYALGQVFFRSFAERTPRGQRAIKIILSVTLACALSGLFGRVWFFVVLSALFIFFLYVHAWYLPRHGVNGWTGESLTKEDAIRSQKLDN